MKSEIWVGDTAQLVECLPSMEEAVGSLYNTTGYVDLHQ